MPVDSISQSRILRNLAICSVLVAITCVAYHRVPYLEFVYFDDPGYVLDNKHVHKGLLNKDFKENIHWGLIDSFGEQSNWHPLTWWSHMLDVQIFGFNNVHEPNPGGPHLVNLVFHVSNTLLLFFLLQWMTGAAWPSAVVAALFAVHPMHVESVAWVAERKDLLSTFLELLTIGAYLWYVRCLKATAGRPLEERIPPAVAWYLPVFLLFALTLMAKPMPLTLPCLLLLLDYWPLGRLTLRAAPKQQPAARKQPEISRAARARLARSQSSRHRRDASRTQRWRWEAVLWLVAEKLPLLALSVVSSRITYLAQQKGASMANLNSLPLLLRIGNVLTGYARYIGGLFWPFDMAAFYPYQTMADATYATYAVVAAEILLVITVAAVVGAFYGRRYLAVGWFWFLGTLVPVIGLVQVGDQSMADRYSYFTYTGLFIMLVWGAADLLGRWRPSRAVLLAAAAAVVAGCAALAAGALGSWPRGTTASYGCLSVMGLLLVGLWAAAHRLERSRPGASTPAAAALTVLAAVLFAAAVGVLVAGTVPVLARHFLPTRLQAGHWQELAMGRYWGLALLGLVVVAAWGAADLLGRWFQGRVLLGATAAAVLAACIVLTAQQVEHWRNSMAAFENTLAVSPDSPAFENNWGVYLWEKAEGTRGAKPETEEEVRAYRNQAIVHWRKAVEIRPAFSDALNNLGCALRRREPGITEEAYRKQLQEAETCFRAAIFYKKEHSDAHSNLALTLWQLNKPEEAIAEFKEALNLRSDHADAHVTYAQVLTEMAVAAARAGKPEEAQRRIEEALDHVSQVIDLDDRNARALELRGRIRDMQRKPAAAAADRSRAAWLMATSPKAATRNGPLAIQLMMQVLGITAEQPKTLGAVIPEVLQLSGAKPQSLDILAAALAEVDDFGDAAKVAGKALALADQQGDAPLAAAIRGRLQLYQDKKKFRDEQPGFVGQPAGN
jgi:tetratricopeptide (TPR) repeat protein